MELLDMPDEVLLNIMAHLSSMNSLELLNSVSPTCHRLNKLCRDPSLWNTVGAEFAGVSSELLEARGQLDTKMHHYLWLNDEQSVTHEKWKRLEKRRNWKIAQGLLKIGSCLDSKTRKLRLRIPGGRAVCFEDEGERLNPEKILREVVLKRCPNLEELHLEGFDLSELESDELPASVHGLSYDVEGLWEQGPSFAKRDSPRGSENKFLRRVTIRRLAQPPHIVEDSPEESSDAADPPLPSLHAEWLAHRLGLRLSSPGVEMELKIEGFEGLDGWRWKHCPEDDEPVSASLPSYLRPVITAEAEEEDVEEEEET